MEKKCILLSEAFCKKSSHGTLRRVGLQAQAGYSRNQIGHQSVAKRCAESSEAFVGFVFKALSYRNNMKQTTTHAVYAGLHPSALFSRSHERVYSLRAS